MLKPCFSCVSGQEESRKKIVCKRKIRALLMTYTNIHYYCRPFIIGRGHTLFLVPTRNVWDIFTPDSNKNDLVWAVASVLDFRIKISNFYFKIIYIKSRLFRLKKCGFPKMARFWGEIGAIWYNFEIKIRNFYSKFENQEQRLTAQTRSFLFASDVKIYQIPHVSRGNQKKYGHGYTE
jgi:hypothetical protein